MNKTERKALLKRAKEQRLVRANAKNLQSLWYKEAPEDFYLRCHVDLSSQQYGIFIQNYLIKHAELETVKDSEDRGDCKNENGVFHEIKINFKSVEGNFVFLQIRSWQSVGYLFTVIDPDKDYQADYFYLPFEDLHSELRLLGSYTHGTKKGNDINEHRMYSIRFNEGSEAHARWTAKYKLDSYEDALDKLKNMKRKYVFLNTELNRLAPSILFGKKGKNNLTNTI